MSDLSARRCEANASALGDAERQALLAQISGWQVDLAGRSIEKSHRFASGWLETIAFVNALAWICQREDHHPDLVVGYDRCTVRFSTHSAGGLTMNDFICAAKVDALFAQGA